MKVQLIAAVAATLCGAALLTNECASGASARDFPLPRRHVVRTTQQLTAALRHVAAHAEKAYGAGAAMRRLYGQDVNAESLQREVRAVFSSA